MQPHGVRISVGGRPPPPAAAQTPALAPSPSSSSSSSSPQQQQQQQRFRPRPPGDHSGSGQNRFAQSPVDPAGALYDASDRPLLCCSLQGNELVVGSADHALYCYDASSDAGRAIRRLYGKRHGHIDWVSAVAHLPDGRVLSGGGDGKLCIWPPGAAAATSSSSSSSSSSSTRRHPTTTTTATAACQDLDGHASAVAKVMAVPESARLAFSAGYDGTVKLWDTQAKRLLTCLDAAGPNALDPVLDFALGSAHLLSGTRSGALHLWDLATGARLSSAPAAHQGQVTCVVVPSSDKTSTAGAVFATGGQDGRVKVWDTRTQSLACVLRVECHADAGRGTTAAVGCLEAAGPFLCSGGADGRVCVLEPRAGFRVAHAFDHGRAPVYALRAGETGGSAVLFSGGGDGMLLCHDLGAMALCYGLHANRGAVRGLAVSQELGAVVAAGDDGKALVYRY